ncbi:MAG: flavin reductase [Eubacteriales bacterium]
MSNISTISEKTLAQLEKGAFLVCNTAGTANVMTIGWGSIGVMWGKPVVTVPVRFSRMTHDLLEEGSSFTVCVPKKGTMQKELGYCGTKSGRDYNKIEETGLVLAEAKTVTVPILKDCEIILECRTMAKVDLSETMFIDESVVPWTYSNGDFHTLYMGEVVEAYEL